MYVSYEELPVWPRKRTALRQSAHTFRVDYPTLLSDLQRELEHVGARLITLEAGVSLRYVRRDGWPRADAARPPHPGVILRFCTRRSEEEKVFACDQYESWIANLRAISLTLEALRGVNRWGVAQDEEQYQGFRAKAAGERKTAAAALATSAGRAGMG